MADIVWLLRNDCPCISDIGCAQELCNHAADEIERLRAALDKICNGPRDADLDYVDLFVDVKMEARAALEGRDDLA